ncbi:MAG TPA: hypothetical protein PL155_06965 [Candidatus Omnitrophota bacterium]|nr:hypothetical protein [Candidatus Omnitrophota bacterium]HRZ04410.1 hypothetical protein [Candidatus Omnitrophota bacterium]
MPKRIKKYCISVVVALLMLVGQGWAMSEDEYARMAAEGIRISREANGNAQLTNERTAKYLKQFSDEVMREYVEMAQKILRDPALASRIKKKTVACLVKMGYRARVVSESGEERIVFEK